MSTYESLNQQIDRGAIECLNESAVRKVTNILTSGIDSFLESGEGEQLLIKFRFLNPVKIDSIIVKGLPNGVESGTAPKVVRLFANDEDIDFQDAGSNPCTQEIVLEEKHIRGEKLQLRFVRFQNVNSLVLFVAENHGAETTQIAHVELYGTGASCTPLENWKPVQEGDM